MYTHALEFLEEERDAWAPFESLIELSDEALDRPTDPDGPAHGWTGRQLLAHVVGWQELALRAAKELAVNERSPTIAEVRAAWAADGDGYNEAMLREWGELPLDELRRRARAVAGELRGHLTVVPETRWLKNADHMRYFVEDTVEHYEEHAPALEVVLHAARG